MQRTILVLLSLALAAGAAQAAEEKYQRKSGLWELKRTSTVSGGQARVYQMCIDHASDNALSPLADGLPGERCESSRLQRDGDKLNVDAECKISGSVATTHAVITGKFDSAYKVESKTTFSPPMRGHTDSTAVLEAKWTGECKPGQRPGDVIGPRGGKFNLNDIEKTRERGRQRAESTKKGPYVPAPTTPPATK